MELQGIFAPVAGELDRVEVELAGQLDGILRDPLLRAFSRGEGEAIVRHVFRAPGKRLRPGLVLLSARAVGPVRDGSGTVLARMAAAAELLHTASLLHDDVVDRAASRREQVSLNGRYGDRIAVLVGDLLYTRFFHMVAGLPGVGDGPKLRLLDRFCEVTQRMCLAEIAEERRRRPGEEAALEEYLAIIEGKTATLMSACCAAGALLGGAEDGEVALLADYGRWLGLSYQLADDLFDGDAVLSRREVLEAQLLACASRARETACLLRGGDAADSLARFAALLSRPGKEEPRGAVLT